MWLPIYKRGFTSMIRLGYYEMRKRQSYMTAHKIVQRAIHRVLITNLIIIIIMDRMGICFTSVAALWWGEACCLSLCFPTGTCVLCCTLCRFEFWLFGGVFTLRKPWWGGVTNFGWKPPLHNSRNFISQRSTSHATQSFITPGEPQFPQLFCSCMVQLLAGIISLRRVLEANPGRSHGSADTLPLRHSANRIYQSS